MNSCRINERNSQKLVNKNKFSSTNYERCFWNCQMFAQSQEWARKIHSVIYDIKPASFVGAIVWNSLPSDIKECESLEIFRSKITKWTPGNCPCKLCQTYLHQTGYLQIMQFYMYIWIYVFAFLWACMYICLCIVQLCLYIYVFFIVKVDLD